jgi:hypothetical protein
MSGRYSEGPASETSRILGDYIRARAIGSGGEYGTALGLFPAKQVSTNRMPVRRIPSHDNFLFSPSHSEPSLTPQSAFGLPRDLQLIQARADVLPLEGRDSNARTPNPSDKFAAGLGRGLSFAPAFVVYRQQQS